jgi:hypothetical protein
MAGGIRLRSRRACPFFATIEADFVLQTPDNPGQARPRRLMR